MAQVLSAFHIHLHSIHVCVGCFSLTRPTPLSTSQFSSCLSPSSTSATRSSGSSTRRTWKTSATPLPKGVRTPTASYTSTQVMSPRPMTSTSSRTHQSPSHRSVPRTSRLLRTRRRVSQSVVVVCKVRSIRAT